MAYLRTPTGLLIHHAAFADAPVRPESQEIATIGGGRDITRGYAQALMRLMPQDLVLQLRGGGDYQIYREVLRDDQVKAAFAQRQLAVVSKEWEVRAGGTKRIDKQAADFLTEQLQAVNFDRVTEQMLYGVFYGYAVSECLWGIDGSRVTIQQIRVRDRRRFAFDTDQRLRLLTTQNVLPGEELPERKFWWFSCGADHDDEPYGLGLAHWLYWPVFFKRGGMKLWLTFLDKFGAPTAKGTYHAGAQPDEKARLLAALDAIRSESGVIIPEGMTIELLEAARGGAASYESLYDRMARAIAKVLVGQTSTVEGTPGRLGSDQVQSDVRSDLVKADADLVNGSFNRTVARWLTDWNFPGAAYPEVWREVEEPEDLNQVATRDKTLHDIGYKPTPERIQQTYGDGYIESQPPPALAPGAVPGTPASAAAPAFAEQAPSAADRLAAQLATAAAPALANWLDRIRGIVNHAESLEALRDRLLVAYGDLPTDQLAAVMQLGFTVADLTGRFDVADEAGVLKGAESP